MITAEMEHTARRWPQTAAEFEELVDGLQHRLVRFACSRLQSRGDAEDVVQDVFVHAWREREKYRGVESVEPFLFRMTANRATDILRRCKWLGGRIPEDLAVEPALVEMRNMADLLERLPDCQAEVIRLRIHGGLPFDAVARAGLFYSDCKILFPIWNSKTPACAEPAGR